METVNRNQMKSDDLQKVSFEPKPTANFDSVAKPTQLKVKPLSHSMISHVKRTSHEPVIQVSSTEDINDGAATEKNRSESEPAVYESSKGYFIHRSNSLTEQAKHLSEEEILALEIDIFKPLDFYELLFNRMKANDSGKVITSFRELENLCK